MGIKQVNEYNISKASDEIKPEIGINSLTIIGLPVYSGRLPLNATYTLKKLKSNQSPVVIVVVYGNRAFDDSLLELNEMVSECGFKVIAAAAFIGEHSFSTKDKPIAADRPDKQDLIKCATFSSMVLDKLHNQASSNNTLKIAVPGNYPYKKRSQLPVDIYPDTDVSKCDKCGICVDACPTNAISSNRDVITNGELCTWCCACVNACPKEARVFDNPTINAIKEKLFTNCSLRREPEYFL